MPVPRYAAKRDLVEKKIIEALLHIGASVEIISKKGAPDLAVGFRGVNYWLEVKSEDGELTPDQIEWHSKWQGQVNVVRSVEEAFKAIGAIA